MSLVFLKVSSCPKRVCPPCCCINLPLSPGVALLPLILIGQKRKLEIPNLSISSDLKWETSVISEWARVGVSLGEFGVRSWRCWWRRHMSDIYMHRLIELLRKSKYTCTGVQLIYCRNFVVSVSNLHSFSSLVLDHFRLTCDRRTQQQASKLAFQRYPEFNRHLLLALPWWPVLYR